MAHHSSGIMTKKSWGAIFSSLSHTTIYIVVNVPQKDIGDNIVARIHISDMICRFRRLTKVKKYIKDYL